jgi:hypothetical protein
MKIRTKAANFVLAKELNENTNKSTKFWLKIWQDLALEREYDVDIEKYVSNFVMLIINKYGGSSNFGKFSKHHSYY